MKKIYLSLAILAGIGLAGCNDSFLEHAPVTSLTENNAFRSYDNFKSFAWPCYEIFKDNNIANTINGTGQGSCYAGDMNAGYLESRANESGNDYAFGRVQSVASGNGWGFSGTFRRANILLANIDKSEMTDAEKDHWRAVGYFFHSYWYMELINRFGAVPWVNTALNENSPEAYGPRVDREIVADSVLNRLKWAEANIGDFEKQDGANTINRDCIRAAISRFALREATWRKYHGIDGAQKFFDECIRVSRLLMNDYPTLYYGTDGQPAAGYGEMWTTEDLGKVPGVILYMEFVQDIKMANFSALEHMDSHNVEMNQHTVDLYLCKDGKPIATSANYHGDKTPYATFRDRDPRLYHVVMPPYKVKAKVKTKEDPRTWDYTDDPADREYIDIMGPNESCDNPGIGMKRLPGQNWSASLVRRVPNLQGGAQYTIEGKKYGPHAYVASRSGYYVWKNWDNWEENYNNAQVNTADKPVFKIEEVLLNYAEAMFETNQFTQTIADETINKLRKRAGVADMVVAQIDGNFDPKRGKYYPKGNDNGILVDPVLWEIRRERIIELMGEGFGFYDVRRWRMAPWFVNMQQKGMWISKTELSSLTLLNEMTGTSDGANGSMTEGYIYLFNDPLKEGKGWLEKYYLYQVPLEEIALNPNLTQNPGWE
mgnify:CR=1 FL=1